jgi:hypothetical protein
MASSQHLENASMRAAKIAFVLVASLLSAAQPVFAQQVAPPQAPVAQSPVAASVVRELVEAMRLNDGPRIRALFAPQASQAYGDGASKSGPAFFAWLESDIIARKGQVDDAKLAVNGNEVILTGQFRNSSGYRAAANFRLVIEQGRINTWQMRY